MELAWSGLALEPSLGDCGQNREMSHSPPAHLYVHILFMDSYAMQMLQYGKCFCNVVLLCFKFEKGLSRIK